MNTVAQVEAILRAAMDAKREAGWTIEPNVTHDPGKKCCCAVGSITRSGPHSWPTYASRLEIAEAYVVEIVDGFDGLDEMAGTEWFALGAKLRREYVR